MAAQVLSSHQSVLTIPQVGLQHAGNYSVIITNSVFFTPGLASSSAALTVVTDSDQDGMPNDWEAANGLNPNDPADAHQDLDGDGLTNIEEYLAGTDPNDPESVLELHVLSGAMDRAHLNFQALSNRTYSIQYRSSPHSGTWSNLMNIEALSTQRSINYTNFLPAGTLERYYRLVTPISP